MMKFTLTIERLVRRSLLCGGLVAAWMLSASAQAGEAGHIVFVSGEVHTGTRVTTLGDAINEGDELATGKDGYAYLKTVDDGLLILRPASRARIVAYHIDAAVPANTRVKLELLSGVARSVSGKGVKQARQNFRFNTPVAAIGVRGTDFTVFTDQETSNVTVLTGAVVVSGFAGACAPSGTGPCEHAASRELAAGQVGQMLQVRRGQAVPQLMSGGTSAPDTVAPPRPDEPASKATAAPIGATDPSLDPRKASDILSGSGAVHVAVSTPPASVAPASPPDVVATDPVVPVTPVTPVTPTQPVQAATQLVWGRWAAVLGQAATVDTGKLVAEGATRVAMNSYYTVFRTTGADWQVPQQGTAGFALRQSDAFILNEPTGQMTAATLQNGKLQVDFGKATFATSFDLLSGRETFNLQAQGTLSSNGQLNGNSQFASPTNMNVSGSLGSQNDAAYIFSSRLDTKRVANGVTYWSK